MDVELTIKNYRCFGDENPAKIRIRDGFTAFVGPNNAGKTNLLKMFYELRSVFQILAEPAKVVKCTAHGDVRAQLKTSSHPSLVFSNSNERDLSIAVRLVEPWTPNWKYMFESVEITVHRAEPHMVSLSFPRHFKREDGDQFNNIAGDNGRLGLRRVARQRANKYELDITPFIDAMKHLGNAMYVAAPRNVGYRSGDTNDDDMRVGRRFVENWTRYRTSRDPQARRRAEQVSQIVAEALEFRSLEFEKAVEGNGVLVKVDGEYLGLEDLGAGTAQLIVTAFNVALRSPSVVLIDEPEINLHPAMQSEFLELLGSYSSGNVMFTTHNIGLAHSSAEHVYSVQRGEDGMGLVRDFEATVGLPEFVGEMAFSQFRDRGYSTVLLVEGSTDIKTFKQFLRMYGREHEVLVMSLGGSDMIKGSREHELEELRRVGANVWAIIDSEKTSKDAADEAARLAFQETCKKLDIPCHILERRATENYLVDAAIKRVLGDSYSVLGEYEKLKDRQPSWSKSDNWRIAAEMELDDLDNDLGELIERLVQSTEFGRPEPAEIDEMTAKES